MMRDKQLRWCHGGLIFAAILMILSGCDRSSPKEDSQVKKKPSYAAPEARTPPSQGYVGSQACVECHGEISEHFSHHPMGQSLAKVLDATPLEDYGDQYQFEVQSDPQSALVTSYEIIKSGDGVIHREVLKTKEGEELYTLDVPVAYAVGSGQQGRSYLVNHSGLLFMSPVSWYSEKSRWDLSPGYEEGNLRFGRRVVDGCLRCHAGQVAHQPDSLDRFEPDPFIEEAIGCENCHGPGEEHIKFQQDDLDIQEDPIVNPADLSPRARDHVCFQCHLVGEHRLTRYGRGEFDFRPGDDLTDIWTIFLEGSGVAGDQSAAAVSQVGQMLASTCYQKSNEKMGCTSCHSPHESPKPDETISFYQSRCLACHSSSEGSSLSSGDFASDPECSEPLEARLEISPENSCIQCHMPSRGASDIPHISQTDHRVLRTSEPDEEQKQNEQPQLHIFGENSGLIPRSEMNRAQAISLAKVAEDSRDVVLALDVISVLKEWLEVVPGDLEAQISLGTAYASLPNYSQAVKIWETALEEHPEHESLLRKLMVLHHDNNQFEDGVKYAQRLVKVNSWNYEYYGRLTHMLGQLNRRDDAIKAGQRALELNPASAHVHRWIAEIYELEKDIKRSEYHQRQFDLRVKTN